MYRDTSSVDCAPLLFILLSFYYYLTVILRCQLQFWVGFITVISDLTVKRVRVYKLRGWWCSASAHDCGENVPFLRLK